MRIGLETPLPCDVETAWAHLRTTRLLHYVARPLLRFDPVEPPVLPAEWQPGRYLVALRLFGVLPLGTQWIDIEIPAEERRPDGPIHRVRDRGSSALLSTWDHRITLGPTPGGGCLYRDDVEIRAGLLTPTIWLFARLFFRHRQRRWRRLVANAFDYAR